jgi:hypothetical protein
MRRNDKPNVVDLGPLRALAGEPPATLMAQVRNAWPDIVAALKAGHSLKTVHQRLEEGGFRISYRTLVGYVNRIRATEDLPENEDSPSD